MKINSVKGTNDILPDELEFWKHIESKIHIIMNSFGYKEIRTPVFEKTELFIRGIGDETDIVNKEMYTWVDQSENSLTLKPELTAPVARAFIQHQMGRVKPLHRLYYYDSLFRRERPQKGRQRQFYQFGVEAIGSPYPEQDVEVIALAYYIYKKFNIDDLQIRINSIGSDESRPSYLKQLVQSLKKYNSELCKICNNRLKLNPLRVFDCKNPKCQDIFDDKAPLIFDYISKEEQFHFQQILSMLNEMKIPFYHDKKLVRGLDYYTNTTFEINSKQLGAQDALCGGGRYNNLIEQLGGKATPAVGFAAGMERLLLAISKQEYIKQNPDIYLISIGEKANILSSKIALEIRVQCNKQVLLETLRRSLKSQMREANKCNAQLVLIIGDDEIKKNTIIVKNMITGEQQNIDINKIIYFLKNV